MEPKVGFIGLGVMGLPMAGHVAKKFSTTVYDVSPEPMKEFPEAARGGSVPEVAERSDLVLLSLPSSHIVEEVVLGSAGLITALKPGSAIIDNSTTDPSISRKMAGALAEKGIDFLDAPVSGGEGGAQKASLSIMVGGSEEVLERYLPVLQAMGTTIVRVGDVGSGGVAKLVNNMIVGSAFTVAAEGFALAKKAGLDPKLLYQAIKNGWAGSPVLDVAAPAMYNHDFNPPGGTNIIYKDLGYAMDLAKQYDAPVPITAQVVEVFKTARAKGYGGLFQPGIIQLWEEVLGIRLDQ
ncbi:MAG: NAD(P)-dependent oxidoreductase [Spirochaetaceae bacterium]